MWECVVLNVWCKGWVMQALANGPLRSAARIRVQQRSGPEWLGKLKWHEEPVRKLMALEIL
jgi:hypothetical protein